MEEARISEAKARRRGRIIRVLVGVLVIGIAATAIVLLAQEDPPGDDEADGSTTTTTTTTAPEDTTSTEPATPVELPPGPEGATIEGETPCPAADGSEERVAVFAQAPPVCIEDGVSYEADVAIDLVDEAGEATDAGTITIALDSEAAPTMVNNFVVLSRYKFYDGIPFHRLVPDFVAQVGGAGTPGPDGAPDYGTTGPGYSLPDEEHPEDGYAVGDVAMARSDTVSGSQLFIVTSESALQPLDQAGNYPLLGSVTAGLDLAVEMSTKGDAASNGTPTALYVIRSVTIREV
jgi:peptidylprolyl isomerase